MILPIVLLAAGGLGIYAVTKQAGKEGAGKQPPPEVKKPIEKMASDPDFAALVRKHDQKRIGDIPKEELNLLRDHFEANVRLGKIGAVIAMPGPVPGTPKIPDAYLLRKKANESEKDLAGALGVYNNIPDWHLYARPIKGQKEWGFLGTGINLQKLARFTANTISPVKVSGKEPDEKELEGGP